MQRAAHGSHSIQTAPGSLCSRPLKFSQVLSAEGQPWPPRGKGLERSAGEDRTAPSSCSIVYLEKRCKKTQTALKTASHLPLKTPGSAVTGIRIIPREISLRLQDLQGSSLPLAFKPAERNSSKYLHFFLLVLVKMLKRCQWSCVMRGRRHKVPLPSCSLQDEVCTQDALRTLR